MNFVKVLTIAFKIGAQTKCRFTPIPVLLLSSPQRAEARFLVCTEYPLFCDTLQIGWLPHVPQPQP